LPYHSGICASILAGKDGRHRIDWTATEWGRRRMNGEPVQGSEWRGEFDRIVNSSFRDRAEPLGPYMRWPLGAALVLIAAQVIASALDALVAGSLLTGGHSTQVTTASLLWTFSVTTVVAIVLGWAAYNVRSRLLPALYAALVVEVVEVIGRSVSVAIHSQVPLGDYFGLAWAAAAVVTLALPSSRAYCTRRRTGRPARARRLRA
jgi:hypothetical protein